MLKSFQTKIFPLAILSVLFAPFSAQGAFRSVSADLQIKNLSRYTEFSKSVQASNGERVGIQAVVRAFWNVEAVSAVVSLPVGLSYVEGSIKFNNPAVTDFKVNSTSNLGAYITVNLGNLNQIVAQTIYLEAQVNNLAAPSVGILSPTLEASGVGSEVVKDQASVLTGPVAASGGSVLGAAVAPASGLDFSLAAMNETKNVDAALTLASREDYITYTLTAKNTTAAATNGFVVSINLSQVLPFADLVEKGGGSLSGETLSFPAVSIPANGSVSKSFKVRVKYFLAENANYQISAAYGNSVKVLVSQPQVLGEFVAPQTGANTLGAVFALLLTAGYGLLRHRKVLLSKLFS